MLSFFFLFLSLSLYMYIFIVMRGRRTKKDTEKKESRGKSPIAISFHRGAYIYIGRFVLHIFAVTDESSSFSFDYIGWRIDLFSQNYSYIIIVILRASLLAFYYLILLLSDKITYVLPRNMICRVERTMTSLMTTPEREKQQFSFRLRRRRQRHNWE